MNEDCEDIYDENFRERQTNTSLTFLVGVAEASYRTLTLYRADIFDTPTNMMNYSVHEKILDILKPAEDEEIIVTFTKRRKK
jgi:hypothetical protein